MSSTFRTFVILLEILGLGISKNVQVFEGNVQTGAKCGQMGE
jgi:hypothetical protein